MTPSQLWPPSFPDIFHIHTDPVHHIAHPHYWPMFKVWPIKFSEDLTPPPPPPPKYWDFHVFVSRTCLVHAHFLNPVVYSGVLAYTSSFCVLFNKMVDWDKVAMNFLCLKYEMDLSVIHILALKTHWTCIACNVGSVCTIWTRIRFWWDMARPGMGEIFVFKLELSVYVRYT